MRNLGGCFYGVLMNKLNVVPGKFYKTLSETLDELRLKFSEKELSMPCETVLILAEAQDHNWVGQWPTGTLIKDIFYLCEQAKVYALESEVK